MKRRLMVIGLLLASGSVLAAKPAPTEPMFLTIETNGTINIPSGGIVTISPLSPPPAKILWGDNSFWGPQAPQKIETVLEGLAGEEKELTLISSESGFPRDTSEKMTDISAQIYFLHFGDNSLAFGYGDAPASFKVSGLPHGLSNLYTYECTDGDCGNFGVRSVPVPAAAWLFGSGLIGLFGIARKRKAD